MSRRPPVYPKRPHASGQARIKVHGQQIYLGRWGSPESYQKFEEVLTQWRTGKVSPKAKAATVAEVVAAFMTHAEATYSERGREVPQFRLAAAPLLRLYGMLPVDRFGFIELEEVQLAMATGDWRTDEEAKRYKERGWEVSLCRNVVNRRIVRIRTIWRWAESRRLVPAGSWAALSALPGLKKNSRVVRHSKPRKAATWEQVQKVLPHIQAKRKRRPCAAMLALQWWTGMRSCEVRIMRTCDIDTNGPTVDGKRIWLYRPEKHKNDWRDDGNQRVVPLGAECQAILRQWLRPHEPRAYLFGPRVRGDRPYDSFGYCQAVRRACELAGVSIQPYQCRHGAKQRITRECGLDFARAVLGQKSIQTTDGYDAGIDLEMAARAAARLG